MDDLEDLGNLGHEPAPSWISTWAVWAPPQIQMYVEEVADWGPLSAEQCKALIQQLPPPPKGWGDSMMVNPEFEPAIRRFEFDLDRGAIPPGVLPDDLVTWAEQVDVSLPPLFIDAVKERAKKRVASTATGNSVAYPPWAPMPVNQPVMPASRSSKPGRPKTKARTVDAMQRAARQLVERNQKAGVATTLEGVARALHKMPAFSGKQLGTIKRYLSGTPTTRATAVAVQVATQASRGKKRS